MKYGKCNDDVNKRSVTTVIPGLGDGESKKKGEWREIVSGMIV